MNNLSKSEITGIILAGGKSRRMGTDKGLLLYNGKPMIQYSIDLLSSFCERIVISTSNPAYNVFGLETIPDLVPQLGPMGGLYSCLKASKTSVNLCLPCDIPQMNLSVLNQLVEKSDIISCIVACTPYPEPLVAIYPLTVISVIEQLINTGNYKMADIFNLTPVKYIPLEEFHGENIEKYFTNMNTPTDLTE
jgi:molybdenum cofactor guanylyltransferase